MKKFTVLLVAMLIASVSFAQISTTKKVVKTDGKTINFKGIPSKANHQRANNSYWFNLIEDAIVYVGTESEYSFPIIQCDTNNLVHYQSGDAHNQFNSLGQVYNWDYEGWDYMYNYSGAPANVPHMPSTTTYSIDSIMLAWYYGRGTNVPGEVVDTLAISYVIGIDPNDDITTIGYTDDDGSFVSVSSMPFIPFNHTTSLASTTPDPSSSSFANTLESATVIYDKIPLTVADTTGNDVPYFTLPTPDGLSNLTQKQIAVIVTFIPGCDRTPASVIGEDLDRFSLLMWDDPRDGYNTYGSDELINDYQTGLFHDADNYKPNNVWYPIYQPNVIWEGNPKPSIGLLVSCNDCETVNVPEMEKKPLTVYPNPATNQFTVNTGNDEKASIQLFNIVGQQVYSETFTGSTTVNVANLHSGVYMLKVNQNGKVNTTKVIVK